MKSTLTLFLAISFLGMAVFSFWGMDYNEMRNHGACVAAITQGSMCPEADSTFAFLNFHINAFKTFSSAVFEPLFWAGLLAISFLLFIIISFLSSESCPSLAVLRPYFKRRIQELSLLASLGFIDWWALHEKRDPDILIAL